MKTIRALFLRKAQIVGAQHRHFKHTLSPQTSSAQASSCRQLPSTYMLLTGIWLKSCGTDREGTSVWRLGLFNPQASFASICNVEEWKACYYKPALLQSTVLNGTCCSSC